MKREALLKDLRVASGILFFNENEILFTMLFFGLGDVGGGGGGFP